MIGTVAAVDLGATSGRVILGRVGPGELSIRSVARFSNDPVRLRENGVDGLHWNINELYRSVLAGLAAALREEPGLASIGVDSWAVDYALLRDGRLLGTPYHYRDERSLVGVAAVHERISQAELYAVNGLQFLPFNTLYQLTTDRIAGRLETSDTMLLIPDLIGYWLTGVESTEYTNASTTGLLRGGAWGNRASDCRAPAPTEPAKEGPSEAHGTSRPPAAETAEARETHPSTSSGNEGTAGWNDPLLRRLGIPRRLFPALVAPGTRIGPLLAGTATEIGSTGPLEVSTVGSHDTASAVVAVPMLGGNAAYISCGTWGLVGVELDRPVISDAGRAANFTNEGGVDGRIRYLHNVMGLWLLSESVRGWHREGRPGELPELIAQAASVPAPPAVFDTNDPRFLTPGDMPARIRDWYRERGLSAPDSPPEIVRAIVESLAAAFATAVRQAGELSGQSIATIHLVGGGSQNELLCQLTADHSGLPVLAGPVEATAIGNVLVQARTRGLVTGSLESLRSLVANAFVPRRYLPRSSRSR